VVWTLRLAIAHNTGAAVSILSGRGVGPSSALAGLGVIAGLALSSPMFRTRTGVIAIGAVIGGALGNLVDRAFRGHDGFLQGAVVDFIDFRWWPVFNIADMCIVLGVIAIAISTAFSARPVGSEVESDDR